MRYYVEAYDIQHRQILGNLDGQGAYDCKYPQRTNWFKALATFRTRNNRVRYYKIVSRNQAVPGQWVERFRVPNNTFTFNTGDTNQ